MGDGLKLKIHGRDKYAFKLKPNTQLYKERDAFNCELDEDINLSFALENKLSRQLIDVPEKQKKDPRASTVIQ